MNSYTSEEGHDYLRDDCFSDFKTSSLLETTSQLETTSILETTSLVGADELGVIENYTKNQSICSEIDLLSATMPHSESVSFSIPPSESSFPSSARNSKRIPSITSAQYTAQSITSSQDLASKSIISSSSDSISKKPVSNKTKHEIHARLDILTLANRDITERANVRQKRAIEKIKVLEKTIFGLKSGIEDDSVRIRDLKADNDRLKRVVRKRDDRILDLTNQQHGDTGSVPHSKGEDGFKLQMDLLKENAVLRLNNTKIMHKLRSQMGNEFALWSKCLDSCGESEVGIRNRETDRILELRNPTTWKSESVVIDQSVQTERPICATHDGIIAGLEIQLKDLEVRFIDEQKSKNALTDSLGILRTETTELEKTFRGIALEMEVVKRSELELIEGVNTREMSLRAYVSQNEDLVEQIKTLKQSLKMHIDARIVIRKMGDPNHQAGDEYDASDPVSVVEYKWRLDRHRFTAESQMQTQLIHKHESEIRNLKLEIQTRIKTMHDGTEWALLLAKNSVSADDARRAQEEIRTRGSCISILESEVSKLKTKIDVLIKSESDLKARCRNMREDVQRKDLLMTIKNGRIEESEKKIQNLNSKVKATGTYNLEKDSLVKLLKGKIEDLELNSDFNGAQDDEMVTLKSNYKVIKADAAKKGDLIKSLKAKVVEKEAEITRMLLTAKPIDPKTLGSLQNHVKITKARMSELENFMLDAKRREEEFKSVLVKSVEILFARQKSNEGNQEDVLIDGVEAGVITTYAQQISRKYLQMDWDSVLETSRTPDFKSTRNRLEKL